MVSSPGYYPHGTGPIRRRTSCEWDRARSEMEQEQSKCDHARERKWKQNLLFFIRNNDSTTACIFAFGDSHDTLLTSWNSSDDRFAIFTAISCPQHLAPTRYTWLQQISTCPIFFCTRHTLHMCIVVYCQLAKVYYWQSAFNLALMNAINGHSLVLLIPNCSRNYLLLLDPAITLTL